MHAITRQPGLELDRCALTHVAREPIDVGAARAHHAAYEDALRSLGVEVHSLPPLDGFPDAMFVEDTAIVLDEVAVLTCPGAKSRRGEVASIRRALSPHRSLLELPVTDASGAVGTDEPGPSATTVDGGDVLRIGKTLFVGLSTRTRPAALDALGHLVVPYGYRVVGVPLQECLHLKTGACALDDDRVLLNPRWIDGSAFEGRELIEVDPHEPFAANVVRVGDALLYPAEHVRTRARIEACVSGPVVTVPNAELAKAEGGLTCLSLLFS